MCGPPVLALASAALAAGGQIYSGITANQQAGYEARVDNQNARLAEEQARDSQANTQIEAQRRYREQSRLQGQQAAAMGANGIDLGFGSALDVARDTTMIGAEDVGQIYKGGFERTRGFEINAYNYRSSAAAARARGKAALVSTAFNVGSTALGAASQYSKAKNPGGGY